jgi:transcriptional regulator with XRE-family HTH domain
MQTGNCDPILPMAHPEVTTPANAPPANGAPIMHRVRTVRIQQGVSLRTVSRHTGRDVRSLRVQEDETADLRLSDLYEWQRVLDVPVSELLVESEAPLSRPVMERAQLIRLMKTAAAMLEHAPNTAMRCMAETLVAQLTEIMPELKEVSAWHTYGQRRSLNEYGRVVDRRLADEWFQGRDDD